MTVAGIAGSPPEQGFQVPSPHLVKAAHEFEAAMMKELLAPMIPGQEGEDTEGGSGSALSQFAGEALGKAISERGGFGIANSILKQLAPEDKRSSLAKSNHSGATSVLIEKAKSDPKRALR